MRVLLLGASGLLGHNVLLQLQRCGHEPVLLLRSPLHVTFPKELASRTVKLPKSGEPFPYELLREAAQGCDAIVNCAGTTNMALSSLDDYRPINSELPRKLIRLMDELDLKTLVHVSSANTIGYGSPNAPADESLPMRSPFSDSFYALSKAEGERVLIEAAKDHHDYHIVILNPGFMIGPYDAKPSSGQLLLTGFRHRLMVAPKGGKAFIHVADVAATAVNALTMGVSGQRYLLTTESLSLQEFYALQAQVMGYKQHFVALPDAVVRVAGRVGDALQMLGIHSQLSSRNVRQLLVREYYNSQRAVKELEMPHTPIRQAIEDFFLWYSHL